MAMKFIPGQSYNTIKRLGVVKGADGFHISQRTGKDAPDLDPSESLIFVRNESGKLWFKRQDGLEIRGHKSHFDPDDNYNKANADVSVAPKQSKAKEAPEQKKKLTSREQTELDEAVKRLDALLAEAELVVRDTEFI
jgi:hypothetical protein